MEPTPPNGLCEDVWRGSSRAAGLQSRPLSFCDS